MLFFKKETLLKSVVSFLVISMLIVPQVSKAVLHIIQESKIVGNHRKLKVRHGHSWVGGNHFYYDLGNKMIVQLLQNTSTIKASVNA